MNAYLVSSMISDIDDICLSLYGLCWSSPLYFSIDDNHPYDVIKTYFNHLNLFIHYENSLQGNPHPSPVLECFGADRVGRSPTLPKHRKLTVGLLAALHSQQGHPHQFIHPGYHGLVHPSAHPLQLHPCEYNDPHFVHQPSLPNFCTNDKHSTDTEVQPGAFDCEHSGDPSGK